MPRSAPSLSLAAVLLATACSSPPPPPPGGQDPVYYKPGFYAKVLNGQLWVARADTKPAEMLARGQEFERNTSRFHGGPDGMTINGPDGDTIDDYLQAKR